MKKAAVILFSAVVLAAGATTLIADNAEPLVTYTPSSSTVEAGGSFEVTIGFSNIKDAVGYAVMLEDMDFGDAEVSMIGIHYEDIGEYPADLFEPAPDDFNDIAAAYLAPVDLDGDYVRYGFTIPEEIEEGTVIEVSFLTKVLDVNNAEISGSELTTISVTVGAEGSHELLGDIDADNDVSITDCLALFRHCMLPDVYSVPYKGSMDFNKDGNLDIADCLALFRYSMLPDIYPLD